MTRGSSCSTLKPTTSFARSPRAASSQGPSTGGTLRPVCSRETRGSLGERLRSRASRWPREPSSEPPSETLPTQMSFCPPPLLHGDRPASDPTAVPAASDALPACPPRWWISVNLLKVLPRFSFYFSKGLNQHRGAERAVSTPSVVTLSYSSLTARL